MRAHIHGRRGDAPSHWRRGVRMARGYLPAMGRGHGGGRRDLTDAEEAEVVAGIAPFDKNDDQLVCMKDFHPSGNTPAFPPGFFKLKDNTAAAGG